MAAELYIRTLELDGLNWIAAADQPLVLDATIVVPSVNPDQWINARVSGGAAQLYARNTVVTLRSVDLSRLEFNGNLNNRVMIVAQSRV